MSDQTQQFKNLSRIHLLRGKPDAIKHQKLLLNDGQPLHIEGAYNYLTVSSTNKAEALKIEPICARTVHGWCSDMIDETFMINPDETSRKGYYIFSGTPSTKNDNGVTPGHGYIGFQNKFEFTWLKSLNDESSRDEAILTISSDDKANKSYIDISPDCTLKSPVTQINTLKGYNNNKIQQLVFAKECTLIEDTNAIKLISDDSIIQANIFEVQSKKAQSLLSITSSTENNSSRMQINTPVTIGSTNTTKNCDIHGDLKVNSISFWNPDQDMTINHLTVKSINLKLE